MARERELRARTIELSVSVLEALKDKPMCFLDLCQHFGISTRLGVKGAYSRRYLELLDAVTLLQPEGPGRRVATAIKRGEEIDRKFVLYRVDDEARLGEWGLRKPRHGDIQEDLETAILKLKGFPIS